MADVAAVPHVSNDAALPFAGLIPMFATFVHPTAQQRVGEVLASGFLSEGQVVKAFETRLAAELGLLHPAALNSGTSALHLALEVAGVEAGDEVIMPAQTFVASATAAVQAAARPVFADIEYLTGNLDAADVAARITPRTKAIMAVHWGGYPCDMAAIQAIADQHGLVVIEDAAHALGATYRGQAVGSVSDYTCFSFQAIKHLTTGDGGALCARDPEKARAVFRRRWFGIDRDATSVAEEGERDYDLTEVGYKYHLSDYAAALGLANMDGLGQRLAARRAWAQQYRAGLQQVPGLRHFEQETDRQSAHWLFGMHVENRLEFVRALKDRGVATSVVHRGIDHNSLFGGLRPDLPEQRRFDATQIHIPLHDALTDEQVGYVVEAIRRGW